MKRSEKEQIIADVKEMIEKAKGMYFADFTGITVEHITELRREFRKSNIDYRVVKNTLVRKALESVTGYDQVIPKLVGHTGIAFGYEDPAAPAKIIKKFRDKHNKLALKVCVLENQVFDGTHLDEIAKLPSRNDLIAGIIGSIQSPISSVVGAINALARDLVTIIDAIEKKKAA
ncbi:MAG: 50S ribosomal protein L10 [Chlorobiaceae bacterium]|nr:50S ribosomal protein L10 [Chlorobiaceae bacterium]